MRWSLAGALAAIVAFGAGQSDASVITLDASARGWHFADGRSNGRAPMNNTFTGWGHDTNDVNSWFGFDLSAVLGTVVAVELLLDIDDYESPDDSETLLLRDVATPPGMLGTVDSVPMFHDLMTGSIYGTHSFTSADPGHLVAISLNAAGVADVDAAIGGLWEVGGHLSTLSRRGPYEAIFWASWGDPSTTRLRITTVPEPGSVAMLCLGLALLFRKRNT